MSEDAAAPGCSMLEGTILHIEARNLVKTFKKRTVVDRVSLRVDKGEIVGLLGPNGAGKTGVARRAAVTCSIFSFG